ncbi:hypothetical protein ALON55S_00328 [Alishewanella longhuensis]
MMLAALSVETDAERQVAVYPLSMPVVIILRAQSYQANTKTELAECCDGPH